MAHSELRTPNSELHFRTKRLPLVVILLLISFGFWSPMVPPGFSGPTDRDLENTYNQTRQSFYALDKSPQRKDRQNWQPLLEGFQNIYKQHPGTVWGEKSMFMVGRIYYILYPSSGVESDLDLALDHFSRFVNHYPQSPLADDALFLSAEIYFLHKRNPGKALETAQLLIQNYPKGDMKKKAEELLLKMEKGRPAPETDPGIPNQEDESPEEKRPPTGEENPRQSFTRVTGLRHWSSPNYTRIIVDVEDKISFRHRLLKKDPSIEKPERLYLDLYPARLALGRASPLVIKDGLLKGARIGQYEASTVRLVLDIESIKGYKIFTLENPFRLIVDVSGKEKIADRPTEPAGRERKLSLAQQLGLGVKRVIIDAGHGGKDKGATGKGGLYEKDLTLKIAKKFAQRIQQDLKLEALLTRETDHFVRLEDRTAIANTKHADLFVSIHVNASPNPLAEGIETYFLNLATDEESIRVAARENATSTKRISDMQKILKDLMLNTKIDESSRLAGHVQQTLIRSITEKYPPVKNLGVKQAPFYVLIGAQMPAILVEVSFISNDRERERLCQDEYLDRIVDGLLNGIDGYIKEIKLAGVSK
ncbi:MAG: N-acetylmuramoyl-L-alanine amidase [Deltaproteobacteria bacterium]|nr:N-acetylmuramoyl-L-alanine amidase [Deltaproteobacteria bacterium]